MGDSVRGYTVAKSARKHMLRVGSEEFVQVWYLILRIGDSGLLGSFGQKSE